MAPTSKREISQRRAHVRELLDGYIAAKEEASRTYEAYHAQLQELQERCRHEHVIVTTSAHRSFDPDEGHDDECRACLVCGLTEMSAVLYGAKFEKLLNPFRRFEKNVPFEHKSWGDLKKFVLRFSVPKLVKLCQEKGYIYFA